MSHMSNKSIDERNRVIDDTIEIKCRECPNWFAPDAEHEWGMFCSEECLEAHDAGQETYRKAEIERKERERFWQERVFDEWLPEHMESWRRLQNLRNGLPPILTRQ